MDIIINHGNRLFSNPVFQNVRNFSDVISLDANIDAPPESNNAPAKEYRAEKLADVTAEYVIEGLK